MKGEIQKKLFGTDGIRGVANQYPMTAELALSVGRALSYIFQNGDRAKILIGKDTRLSGYMIETALASGICSMGADAIMTGPIPTPGIAFLTHSMRADAGIVISASHNLFADNGIKIFDGDGFKLPDDVEKRIEHLILSGEIDHHRPTAGDVGRSWRIDDARGRYIEFVKKTFPKEYSLEGLTVVVDCAHGATYHIAPTVFEELGAKVIPISIHPNGKNINDNCGAVFPKSMSEEVVKHGADVGIALDGDGDRVVFSDETGQVIDGDAVLAVCAEELLSQNLLKEKTLVATVMSNHGIDDYLAPLGARVVRANVGDRYVVERMKKEGYTLGGENSGHIVFLNHSTTGDGLIAALQVLSLMRRRGEKLSKIIAGYHSYPQIMKNIRVRERKDLNLVPDVQKMMHDFESTLGSHGTLLVRYSGTEPLIRIMIEGPEQSEIQKMATDLSSCIERHLR